MSSSRRKPHDESTPGARPRGGGRSTSRQPYESPRITFREPLEQVSAVCDPLSGGKANPIDCIIGSS